MVESCVAVAVLPLDKSVSCSADLSVGVLQPLKIRQMSKVSKILLGDFMTSSLGCGCCDVKD